MTKAELIEILKKYRNEASDEDALNAIELYPEWKSGVAYEDGKRVRYNGVLYKCITTHDSQDTWTPTDAPSLWTKVLIPSPTEIPEWEHPESTNSYAKGDKVKHNGKTWVSIIDGNVWEPGVYGWEEVIE